MLKRISHQKFGLGVVLAERKSESGKLVSVVVFDNCPNEEKVLLSEFLQESKARMPQSSKKAKRKSPPKAKPEPVSDELLVPVPDAYLDEDPEETEPVKATSQEP